jgi:uroporphyrinogen-III decarboxylase
MSAEASPQRPCNWAGLTPEEKRGWRFDRTDMARAERILGPTCCIEGNVPTSLLAAGTPEEVTAECRRLIEACAPGGGYILGSGGTVEFPRLANLKAMAAAAREYGRYC